MGDPEFSGGVNSQIGWAKGSFALGDDDDDKVDFTMTSSWNEYDVVIISSSSSVNSYIGIHATHS